ncbi:MAG: sigma-70 family RNA polymerase sigma factor [Rhodothermales bacterium]|nr:sigma-70 family RNA polymerase sigma factor [Rhodothermales bacterium]
MDSILRGVEDGHAESVQQLFDLLYGELRERAHGQRRRWDGNLTLNTTAILHEAYIKLAGSALERVQDQAHFLALASRAMRQVLMDYARRAQAQRRGAGARHVALDEALPAGSSMPHTVVTELLDLERALERLGTQHPDAVAVVECRFFGGMTVAETAAALNISTPTVKRRWAVARSWLYAVVVSDHGEIVQGA